ncbi:Crp/Fnr family transcriptional regulator [Miltoncostaea marina]|uniref:Crp/Fnr family transcriptional regulator n=1 Tax=Miltoncostaea marina TaxID=2843215 RepID=UPI001C3CDD1F|nr:Crp/Fnr family transcriptional regulator [Miltoncostaea marina]
MSAPPALRAIELFAGLGDDAVAAAVDEAATLRLAAGEEVAVNATDAVCALVGAGRLALVVLTGDGRSRTIGMLEDGDVLVRPSDPWAAGARVRAFAIEDSLLYLVDRARLDAWLRDPTLARNLVRVLTAEIADRELAVAIALEPRVERRLALKLRQLADRWGRVTPDGIRLDLRLTHQELAGMVGAVRESVTIALRRLSEAGEVEVRNRTLIIRRTRDGDGPDDAPGGGA